MSREAFGDPPESQEPPDLCPVCGNDWHAEDCEFGKEVARRLKAERDAHKLAHALENVAMMLRKCAHRLRCNGHEDLSADAVGLLRRLDLLGSPLRREFECLGEPSLCTNPRGCACVPDSKTPNA